MRYGVFSPNVSVTMPAVPAGSTQPCCQPLMVTGVRMAPLAVWAVQPGLTLSGTTSTRCTGDGATSTSRWSDVHFFSCAGVVGALWMWAASGPVRRAPTTVKNGPGLISSSCFPAGRCSGAD